VAVFGTGRESRHPAGSATPHRLFEWECPFDSYIVELSKTILAAYQSNTIVAHKIQPLINNISNASSEGYKRLVMKGVAYQARMAAA